MDLIELKKAIFELDRIPTYYRNEKEKTQLAALLADLKERTGQTLRDLWDEKIKGWDEARDRKTE